MAQPFAHPKTGVFWFRRVVPKDLRKLVGKAEELASLRTKDPAEARVRYAERSAEVEARWANLRVGVRNLTEREAHVLAASAHDEWLALHRDDPSFQIGWHAELYATLWTAAPLPEIEAQPGEPGELPITNVFSHSMRQKCFKEADRILARHGLLVDEWDRSKLAKAVSAAFQRASLTLGRAAQGEIQIAEPSARDSSEAIDGLGDTFSVDKLVQRRPTGQIGSTKKLSLIGLFELWWLEAKVTGLKLNTYQSYRTAITHLGSFLKHDDATLVTADDIVRFKDHRLKTPTKRTGKPPSPKTVKDSDLAALKSVFGWAVINRKLPANPAKELTIKLPKTQRLRDPGFTDEEAHRILAHSLAYKRGSKENLGTAAAKRWVPWICAFTGARVGEIAQARRQDLRRVGDIWVLHITPEAGTVKQNEARDVPLHPQLVEMGFTAFVEARPEGHLFVTPSKTGDVLGPLDGLTNRLRDFVRPTLHGAKVQPNHAWRHRFRTVGRELGIDSSILNAIDGHAIESVSEGYGRVSLQARASAIIKFPYFKVY